MARIFQRTAFVDVKRNLRRLSALVLGLAVPALLGCASPGPAQGSRAAADREAQLGLASFYGPGFHGRPTASGERFDQRDMTAAHRTLPLGTRVRVTNLENGESVVLLVNDRGPYGRNRRKGVIIDVSKGAARRLDFISDGLVRVRVEVLETPGEEGEGGLQ
jgi:rare lipoprotein A